MAKKLKVYIVGSSNILADMFKENKAYRVVDSLKNSDVVVFKGYLPPSPHLCDQHTHNKITVTDDSRKEDELNKEIYEAAVKTGKKCVGLGQSAHLLNMLNGGSCWQHCNGHHAGSHDLLDYLSGDVINVTSNHKNIMIPHSDALIAAVANKATEYEMCNSLKEAMQTITIEVENEWSDVEVVVYPNTNTICFQPDPQFCDVTKEYFFEGILKEYFLGRN